MQRVDWRADWWSKRPELVSIQMSDDLGLDINAWPVVAELTGQPFPWQCVTGEPCGEHVPDVCCPDGRCSAQRVNDDALLSKWDVHLFAVASGRYLAFNIDSTYSRQSLIFQDMRLCGSSGRAA
ncbi:MAG: hypothetical protein ACJAYU_002848 [Bradymonadia bacterium]